MISYCSHYVPALNIVACLIHLIILSYKMLLPFYRSENGGKERLNELIGADIVTSVCC